MAASTKLKFLYILGFLDIFAFILFVPLLFDHLRSLGVSILTIGLLTSLHSGLQLICSPIIGSWSDFRGRGSILQVLLIICATFYSVLGYTTSFPIILLCRIIHGICEHTQMLCGTLLAEIVSSEKFSEVQGQMASIAAMGFIVGPIIGGHLAEYENGFQHACYIVALIFTINFVIVRTFLTSSPHERSKKKSGKQKLPNKKTDRKTDKEKKSVTSEIFHAARQLQNIDWEMYWDIFAFKFLCDFTCGLHYQNLRIVLKDVYNVKPAWIGYGMAITGICGAVTGFQNGWISKLYKNDRNHAHKAFHSCCIFVLSYVLLGISPNLVFVMVSLMLHSASYSIIGITISEIILLKTTSDKRGSISGTAQSMFSLSKLIAPVASGIVYEIHGMTGIATAKVLVASAALVLSLYLFKTKTQDKVKLT